MFGFGTKKSPVSSFESQGEIGYSLNTKEALSDYVKKFTDGQKISENDFNRIAEAIDKFYGKEIRITSVPAGGEEDGIIEIGAPGFFITEREKWNEHAGEAVPGDFTFHFAKAENKGSVH